MGKVCLFKTYRQVNEGYIWPFEVPVLGKNCQLKIEWVCVCTLIQVEAIGRAIVQQAILKNTYKWFRIYGILARFLPHVGVLVKQGCVSEVTGVQVTYAQSLPLQNNLRISMFLG